MTQRNLSFSFTVDKTADEVFAAINDVRGWWSANIDGGTNKLGDEFTYRNKDVHRARMRLTELVPGEKVVWLVLDCYLEPSKGKDEWKDTQVCFELSNRDGKTEVRFTHLGLSPECDCYDACTSGWGFHINESLRELITKGRGRPRQKETLPKKAS